MKIKINKKQLTIASIIGLIYYILYLVNKKKKDSLVLSELPISYNDITSLSKDIYTQYKDGIHSEE